MDTVFTTGRVAERLGTTRSRIHRAVAEGVVRPEATKGGHLRFTAEDVGRLVRRLGFAPHVEGLTREDVLVAAAMLGRPLGLRSARAVARVAGISPTTASRALHRLQHLSLVRRRRRRVMLGTVTDVEVWEIDVRNQRWGELAPVLAQTAFPEGSDVEDGDGPVPAWLRHLFWNAEVHDLDPEQDAAYLAGRIMASDDALAHAWAVVTLPADAFERAARMRGVPVRRAALARNLAREMSNG